MAHANLHRPPCTHTIAFAIGVLLAPVAAEAATCSSLRAELGSLEGKSGKASQIRQLEKQSQKAKCSRGLFSRKSPQCRRILSQIQRSRQQDAPSRNVEQKRASLRSAIARNCGRSPVPDSRQTNLGGGQYRTICVRSCDGYYFPINFSAGRDRFKIDDAYCKQVYGPDRAELYVHRSSDDPHSAVSLDGKRRLAEQPFAFAYRTSFDPKCAAELQHGFSRLSEIVAAYQAERQRVSQGVGASLPVMPLPRPQGAQDPETLANRAGGFSPGQVRPAAEATVRAVGPAYYYEASVPVDGLYREPTRTFDFGLIGSARADVSPE